jgi:hypothetical protein
VPQRVTYIYHKGCRMLRPLTLTCCWVLDACPDWAWSRYAAKKKNDVTLLVISQYHVYPTIDKIYTLFLLWNLTFSNEEICIGYHICSYNKFSNNIHLYVLTVMATDSHTFRHITPCSLIKVKSRFRETFCLHLQSWSRQEASKQTTRHYINKGRTLQLMKVFLLDPTTFYI